MARAEGVGSWRCQRRSWLEARTRSGQVAELPTSRDATQPQPWRSEVDETGTVAVWFCAEIKLKSEYPVDSALGVHFAMWLRAAPPNGA